MIDQQAPAATATVRCRFPECESRAAEGAWVLPGGTPPFAWATFCAEHGREAERRGARHIGWRPKGQTPSEERPA